MYDNIISLGFFCGVAQETERLGLRSTSMPFDWVISTSFESVLTLIENKFDGYIDNDLHFNDNYSNRVDNDRYGIQFFHDFSRNIRIEKQISPVSIKYLRRIKRFLEETTKPTLFIRYIANDEEFDWIRLNQSRIDSTIKSNNSSNSIVFIGHHEMTDDFAYNYFFVLPDKNDVVARKFTQKNAEFRDFLMSDKLIKKSIRRKNMINYSMKCLRRFLSKFRDKVIIHTREKRGK